MNINGYQWPEEPLGVGAVVRPMRTIGEECGITDDRKRGMPSFHDNDPSIIGRLIRLLEELLERDITPDSDVTWYRNRLNEIKKEVNDGQSVHGSETGLGDRPNATVSQEQEAIPGNGRSLPGD